MTSFVLQTVLMPLLMLRAFRPDWVGLRWRAGRTRFGRLVWLTGKTWSDGCPIYLHVVGQRPAGGCVHTIDLHARRRSAAHRSDDSDVRRAA